MLAGAGIRAYLAHRPWPTPTTAWAVVDRKAAAGVMVTASHNPPQYNGYKVYWGNGAQIIPPHDTGIAAAIAKIGRSDQLPMPSLADARGKGLARRSRRGAARSLHRRRRSSCAARRPIRSSSSRTRRCTASARRRPSPPSRVPATHTSTPSRRSASRIPIFRRSRSRTPRRKARWIACSRSPRRSKPTSCSRTIRTPIGCASPCPTRIPASGIARSPAIKSARCSPTTS